MKKIIEEIVELDKLVPGGQAMGKLADGRKVFVWGGLPGEQAKIRLTKLKKSYAEAVATEVLRKSNQRIRPCDECYLSTSPWQIMTEDYELKQKSQLVNESFRQEGVDLLTMVGSRHCTNLASLSQTGQSPKNLGKAKLN